MILYILRNMLVSVSEYLFSLFLKIISVSYNFLHKYLMREEETYSCTQYVFNIWVSTSDYQIWGIFLKIILLLFNPIGMCIYKKLWNSSCTQIFCHYYGNRTDLIMIFIKRKNFTVMKKCEVAYLFHLNPYIFLSNSDN